MTLALERARSEFCPSANLDREQVAVGKDDPALGCRTWKLKWFSEDSLLKFVSLLKAIYAGASMSPLRVRRIP